jgi:hypothetical protein
VIAADASSALAQICNLHASGFDKSVARRHRDAAQDAPFFEGINNEGAGLCALPGALLSFCLKPRGSLFFGFGSPALPLAALLFGQSHFASPNARRSHKASSARQDRRHVG